MSRPTGSLDHCIDLPCELRAARRARHHVAGALRSRGWAEVDVERAMLAVSELVANAVVHGGSDVRLRLRLGDGLRIEVTDRRPAAAVHPRALDPRRTTGRGLQLVDHMSRAWGVARSAGSKTVWCELEPGAADTQVTATA
jgi:anti-sigma regulatory factor (Ser/Thr protein kinase)